MRQVPRDTCTHMLHKTQGYMAEVLSPGPVRNVPISTAKMMGPDSDTSQPHSAQTSESVLLQGRTIGITEGWLLP